MKLCLDEEGVGSEVGSSRREWAADVRHYRCTVSKYRAGCRTYQLDRKRSSKRGSLRRQALVRPKSR